MSKILRVNNGELEFVPVKNLNWLEALRELYSVKVKAGCYLNPIVVKDNNKYGIYFPPNNHEWAKKAADFVSYLADFLSENNIRYDIYTGYYIKEFGFDNYYSVIFEIFDKND